MKNLSKKQDMKKPKVSIVVPAYNEQEYIYDCLKSTQSQKTNIKNEVIVVDNNSKDKTNEIAKSFKNVKVLLEKKQGVGQARKTGTHKAQGDIVIHIDADTRLFPDHVEKVYSHFKNDKELVCLGGQFIFYEGPLYRKMLRKILYKPFLLFAQISSKKTLGPSGNNMAFRKKAYKKTKGFNTNLKFGEDIELCRELKKHGKIKTDLNLKVMTSSRRFKINKKLIVYTINFFSMCIRKKPYRNVLEKN